ncbi:MAG: PBP1A family penicillin-binding protein [Duodenibacillus sp.]|nr:PBP1A family penicillin-binding protein [Duodenibacillus sp.]
MPSVNKLLLIFSPVFWLKAVAWLAGLAGSAALCGASVGLIVFGIIYSQLPPITALSDYKPKVPLRIYTADKVLIGEFGEERRDFTQLSEFPDFMKKAVLAAEDNGFYSHPGIELSGIARAALTNLATGRKGQGGSTITMQVARNFFLSSERTYTRKLYEIVMSFKIENNLSKDEILEIYMNQIYLGQRSYGFASAAQTYFGKKLSELTLGEAATLAGLPVAPSAYNPIANPRRATMRRNYVLGRMRDLGYISAEACEQQSKGLVQHRKPAAQTAANRIAAEKSTHAEYVAELVRMMMHDIFKEDTYTHGLNVYTTIRSKDQASAWAALRAQLLAYDKKYGFRGPLGHIDPAEALKAGELEKAFAGLPSTPGLVPAVIVDIPRNAKSPLTARIDARTVVELDAASRKFAAKALSPKAEPERKLSAGSVVLLQKTDKGWTLSQIPEVQAGFASADFRTGAVRALVGGFDFYLNMFNHVTQAERQPGSSFKPFIYSAAISKGFTPTSIVNDAPIYVDPRLTGGELWEPRNSDGKFDGPMPLNVALRKSKNLVSVRLLQSVGASYAQKHAAKFGFDPEDVPAQLTTALGAVSTTPWQMLGAYSVLANGGYRVRPHLIDHVTDTSGKVIMASGAAQAGDESIRAIDAGNAFIMHYLLNGVTTAGTGARAGAALRRPDMGGKTGTTNNACDAWFAGYMGTVIAVGWMGFDQMHPLGTGETGGGLVLPIWIRYMKEAVSSEPVYERAPPEGVTVAGGVPYYSDNIGGGAAGGGGEQQQESQKERELLRDQLF